MKASRNYVVIAVALIVALLLVSALLFPAPEVMP